MSWKLIAFSALLTFGSGWCLSDLEKQCITKFNEDLNNDFILGTWYRVMHFSLMGDVLPQTRCPTFIYEKPNSTELERYKEEYLKPGIPFSFDDNPIHEGSTRFRPHGLLIGNKQAKFFIMDPKTPFFRPPFEVRIYQRINDQFMLYQDCNLRGFSRWLMSRNRNPSQAEVEAIINNSAEILNLRRQWFCVVR